MQSPKQNGTSTWRAALGLLGLTLGFILLADGSVFQAGWYARYLEPMSSTGIFEQSLRYEWIRPAKPHQILMLGDSRMAEGLSTPIANQTAAGSGYTFANGSITGSSLRCWYYFLRDLDPTRRRYEAIVLPVDDYDDEDGPEDMADRIADVHYLAMRLRYTDLAAFAGSFSSLRRKAEAARGLLFRGSVMQGDIASFVNDPARRFELLQMFAEHGVEWAEGYKGNDHTLAGMTVDWEKRTIQFPDAYPADWRPAVVSRLLRVPSPQTGGYAAYRRRWFSAIARLYSGSPTRFVFIRIPRGPAIRPDSWVRKLSTTVREMGRRRNVLLLDEHTFENLEKPEFFFDGLHLNAAGREIFSRQLAATLPDFLMSHPPEASGAL